MQRPHGTAAAPHDNGDAERTALTEYAAKANRTISLLQEELHATSQFAIRLSRHCEDAKKERSAALGERDAACAVAERAAAQLRLLSDFLAAAAAGGTSLPADVGAVVTGALAAHACSMGVARAHACPRAGPG